MIASKYATLRIGTRLNPNSQDESPLKLFFVASRGIYEGVFFGAKLNHRVGQ